MSFIGGFTDNTVLLWSILGVIVGVIALGCVWVVFQKIHERKHPEEDEAPTLTEALEQTAEESVTAGQKDTVDTTRTEAVLEDMDTSEALRDMPPDEIIDNKKKL